MLTKPHEVFAKALANHYSIGAFNTSNLETSQAIIGAANELKAPVIVQTSETAIAYAGLTIISEIIHFLAQETDVPVVMHLDHGKSLDIIKKCISAGFTSVMIDASTKPLEENIKTVKEVVDYAHTHDVWVEAELGAILGKEGAVKMAGGKTPDDMLTDPKQAKQFIEETGVDALAVSVGTIHGVFEGQEYIRFETLEAIKEAVPHFPLVLHGASGITDEEIKKAVGMNITKINVDTELRLAFDYAIRSYVNQAHAMVDPREVLGAARTEIQKKVTEKITLFGSSGKA